MTSTAAATMPQRMASAPIATAPTRTSVAAETDRVYVGSGSNESTQLRVLDTSNPRRLTQIGAYQLERMAALAADLHDPAVMSDAWS